MHILYTGVHPAAAAAAVKLSALGEKGVCPDGKWWEVAVSDWPLLLFFSVNNGSVRVKRRCWALVFSNGKKKRETNSENQCNVVGRQTNKTLQFLRKKTKQQSSHVE